MFTNCLEIESVNSHVLYPICSSSNASSSSKKTNISETKNLVNEKIYSSIYIPLNQPRIISTTDDDITFLNEDNNFRNSLEKESNTLKTEFLHQISRESNLSNSSSSSSIVASLSALSFSESNSVSSFSSSISYGDIDNHVDEAYRYEKFDEKPTKDLRKIDQSKILLENVSNESAKYSQISNSSDQKVKQIIEIGAVYSSKPFYGKDWLFAKLATHFLIKPTSQEKEKNCLVLLGNSGTGKTHLCCELECPTREHDHIKHLNKQIISIYFLNWLNLKLNSLRHLHFYLTKSLQDFVALKSNNQPSEVHDYFSSNDNNYTNDETENFANKIGDYFINNVLLPLKDFDPWKHEDDEKKDRSSFVIIIDGIDDVVLNSERLRSNNNSNTNLMDSNMVLMYLNKILAYFPHWLTLVLTSKRSTEANYLKSHITRYSIISIDRFVNRESTGKNIISNSKENKVELINSSISSNSIKQLSSTNELCNTTNLANLKDIQIYILKRLDNDVNLKKRFIQTDAVELINLLLIKSNFCILYVEKILDLILADLISSTEIKNIPATLNGFYLYLIKLIINTETPHLTNKKAVLYSIFNLCITDELPLNKATCQAIIFNKLKLQFQDLKIEAIETLFNEIQSLLFIKTDNDYLILHSSLVDWLSDVKFCTKEYLFNFSESFCELSGNKIDVNENKNKIHSDEPTFHLSNLKSPQKALTYQSNAISTDQERSYVQDDDIKENLRSIGEKSSLKSNHDYEQILFGLLTKNDIDSIKQIPHQNTSLTIQLNTMVDSYNQNALLLSVKLNNIMMSDYLVSLGKSTGQTEFLDHCDESGWTPLRYSAWMGNEDIVKILIENGASVDVSDSEGRTALRAACFSGHKNIVDLLLKHGADVNKCDTYNRTVLHVAVYMGHISLVTLLLKNHSNVNQQDALGRGIISTCIYSKCSKPQIKIKIMKILINHGANINEVDKNGQHPLILAVIENQCDMVSAMLELGADIDLIDQNCYTAIAYAVKANYSFMVDYLLKKNAATHILDKNGRSILSMASSFNSKEVLGLLMERGLDEMHKDNSGWTPLHETAFSGYIDIANMLLDYGSEIDSRDNDGKTSIFYACQYGHLDLVKLFLIRNASVNIKSHNGISPLRIACFSNMQDICWYLLNNSRDIDIDYLDTNGKSILHCLIQEKEKNMDMIKLFLQHGASANSKDNEGKIIFNHKSSLSDEKLYRLLLKYNTNLESTDNNKCTPLQAAIANDCMNIVKLILEIKSIKINNRDRNGMTALSLACQLGNYELVNDLLHNGAQITASTINPIKIAQQSGHQNIVKLLQQWTTKGYNFDINNKKQLSYTNKTAVNHNIKPAGSFNVPHKLHEPNIAPTSLSSYLKNFPTQSNNNQKQYAMSYHLPKSSSPTFSKLNKLDVLNENYNAEEANKIETKSSRFKLVKEKLLRKSSNLTSQHPSVKQSKSVESSIVNYKNDLDRLDSASPFANESSSFRIFKYSMLNKNVDNNKKQEIKRSTSFFQKRETFNSQESVRTLKSNKSITNSSFYQMIRKKLKFLKTDESFEDAYDNNKDFVFKVNQIPRSITDTSSISLTNNSNLSTNSVNTNAYSVNHIDKKNDDFAYIFNRKSLNECMNPRKLFPDDFCKVPKPPDNLKPKVKNPSSSSYYKSSVSQYINNKPAPVELNYQNKQSNNKTSKYFNKETSI